MYMEMIDMIEAIKPVTSLALESPIGSLLNANSTNIVINIIDIVNDKINIITSHGFHFFIIHKYNNIDTYLRLFSRPPGVVKISWKNPENFQKKISVAPLYPHLRNPKRVVWRGDTGRGWGEVGIGGEVEGRAWVLDLISSHNLDHVRTELWSSTGILDILLLVPHPCAVCCLSRVPRDLGSVSSKKKWKKVSFYLVVSNIIRYFTEVT